MNLIRYLHRHKKWSGKTFGPGPRTKGIAEHIRKELIEIEKAPRDLMEWIDVIILGMDGAWRSGHTPEAIVQALTEKQAINFKRVYPMPVSQDVPSEHLRQ